MEPRNQVSCPTCESFQARGYPFCPECGRLAPSLLSPGPYAVELDDVPSERIRAEVVRTLNSWFPDLDPLELEKRLRSPSSILISGIDEASAQRILSALKILKATGRVSRHEPEGTSWFKRLWNPGLAVLAASLILALVVKGVPGVALVLLGMAAASAGALLKGRKLVPIVSNVAISSDQHLSELASQYAAVIEQLAPEDSRTLKQLTAAALDVLAHLKSGSVAAVAAGGDRGELHGRLFDAIRTAVHLSAKMVSSKEEQQSQYKHELQRLSDLVTRTSEWFQTVEGDSIKGTDELSAGLQEAARSIDRILQEVRAPSEAFHRTGEKLTP